MNAVAAYQNGVLVPQLRKYMTSLLPGVRGGTFYEPPRNLGIRCLAVVTIRNSSIEIIQCETYAQAAPSGVLC